MDGSSALQIRLGPFDYAMRNYSIEHFPSGCLCGAGNCRGSVTGWKDVSAERKADYEGLLAPYLLEIDRELTASVASPRARGRGFARPSALKTPPRRFDNFW